jgi:hypothetical protein
VVVGTITILANGKLYMQQMFERKKSKDDEHKKIAVLIGEYFERLNLWLNLHFDGLKTTDYWEDVYIHLVRMVVKLANAEKPAPEDVIDVDAVIMPRANDLFQACRLLYQAIGPLRISVIDGQHRIAVMLKYLTHWTIDVDPTQRPHVAFVRGREYTDYDWNTQDGRDKLDEYLKKCGFSTTVRIVQTMNNSNLEDEGQAYSLVREISQSLHKKRSLVDA